MTRDEMNKEIEVLTSEIRTLTGFRHDFEFLI